MTPRSHLTSVARLRPPLEPPTHAPRDVHMLLQGGRPRRGAVSHQPLQPLPVQPHLLCQVQRRAKRFLPRIRFRRREQRCYQLPAGE